MPTKKRGRGAPRKSIPNPAGLAGRVAINLISIRRTRGWSVLEACKQTQISRATWYRLETGNHAQSASRWIDYLAEHLEVDLSRLTRKPRA